MPDQTADDEMGQEKQDQVLQREGLEEELMQEGRSEDAEDIPDAEAEEGQA